MSLAAKGGKRNVRCWKLCGFVLALLAQRWSLHMPYVHASSIADLEQPNDTGLASLAMGCYWLVGRYVMSWVCWVKHGKSIQR